MIKIIYAEYCKNIYFRNCKYDLLCFLYDFIYFKTSINRLALVLVKRIYTLFLKLIFFTKLINLGINLNNFIFWQILSFKVKSLFLKRQCLIHKPQA